MRHTFCCDKFESKAITSLTLHDALGSLKEVIEREMAMNTAPELMCFGLLHDFDILQIAALVAPRNLEFTAASKRVMQELQQLPAFYVQLGGTFDLAKP